MVNPESYTYVVMAELKPTMFDNCTFCKKEIQTNVMKIRCPICNFWRHMKCTQMINSAIGADAYYLSKLYFYHTPVQWYTR